MFPRVFEIANRIAEGSINLVILMMFFCISGSVSEKIAGIICGMNMNAITARTEMSNVAPVSIVFATLRASSLSFTRYSVKMGRNAAVSAPAINKLNKKSGIRKEALYVSVAEVVPKLTAIILSRNRPIA